MDYISHNSTFYNITDFVQQYSNVNDNTPVNRWRELILDNSCVFLKCSYLIREICIIIDSHYRGNNNCTIIFKNITYLQRKDFYIELTDFGIKFNKYKYLDTDGSFITDIYIQTLNIWSIADYRINPSRIYNFNPNAFNRFYYSLWSGSTTLAGGNIIVSMQDYIKFRIIFKNITISFYDNNNSNSFRNLTFNNHKIKHELSDMIFDIKEIFTDAVYKEIMEKISEISP
jgi:hypothetical protein